MDDFVMVPRKITREMAKAIEESDCGPDHPIEAFWQPSWEAALDAAPQQQAEPVPVQSEYLLDVGFRYAHGVHTPTVLIGFAAGDFDGRDKFVAEFKNRAPRITSAQVERLKRLADELVDAATDLAMAEASVLGDPSVRYKREELKDATAALHAALDALTKGTP